MTQPRIQGLTLGAPVGAVEELLPWALTATERAAKTKRIFENMIRKRFCQSGVTRVPLFERVYIVFGRMKSLIISVGILFEHVFVRSFFFNHGFTNKLQWLGENSDYLRGNHYEEISVTIVVSLLSQYKIAWQSNPGPCSLLACCRVTNL